MAKATFHRISKEKQRRILDVAAREFATHGFHKSNINTIAENAGISIGAMYKYFRSKEELFNETVDDGIRMLDDYYTEIVNRRGDPLEKIRSIFTEVICSMEDMHFFPHLYLALISTGMDAFADEYAEKIEQVGRQYLTRLIREGIEDGYIRRDIDIEMAVYFIDNHLMMLLFARVSPFLKIRQQTFLGGETAPARIVEETVNICRRMFVPD